jgi:hypothetical protein
MGRARDKKKRRTLIKKHGFSAFRHSFAAAHMVFCVWTHFTIHFLKFIFYILFFKILKFVELYSNIQFP